MNKLKTKKITRVCLKYSWRFIESFFAFVFFYVMIALYGEAIPCGDLNQEGQYYIYIHNSGVHTEVSMPVNSKVVNWDKFIPTHAYAREGEFEFITMGWGDKGFFLDTPTWAELKVSTALNAAFLPSPTALHVTYGKEPKEGDDMVKVYLTKKQYKQMTSYIKRSFELKKNRVRLIANRGYGKSDNFYEGNCSYHAFRTCNVWTNQVLKSADVRTGIYTLFPSGIIKHLRK